MLTGTVANHGPVGQYKCLEKSASKPDRCVAHLRASLGSFVAGISDGDLHSRPDAAALCLARLLEAPCAFPLQYMFPSLCDDLFDGHLMPGETCLTDEACLQGRCPQVWPECPRPSACVPLSISVTGGVCDGSQQFCATGSVCLWKKCRPASKANLGEPCWQSPPVRPCAGGLRCETHEDGPRCAVQLPDGATCGHAKDVAGGCADGLICHISGLADATGQCTVPLPVGAACVNLDAWARQPQCAPGHSCVTDPVSYWYGEGTCRPLATLGEPCESTGQCRGSDTTCWGDKGKMKCIWRSAPGESCVLDGHCLDGLYCTKGIGVCRDPVSRRVGDPCGDQAHCVADLRCMSGTCRPPFEAGAGCTVDFGAEQNPCGPDLMCHPLERRCVPSCPKPPG